MAHREHNRPKKSGAFFLIILGAVMFIASPMMFDDSPQIGGALIIIGFIVGGFGFYLNFVKKRKI